MEMYNEFEGTVYNRTQFVNTEELRVLEPGDLRDLFVRYLEGLVADTQVHGHHSSVFRSWQEQIAWVLRESQCRKVDENNTLYDAEFANMYRTYVYGRRKG